ncbi:MAG: OB-fold nucleic acid binding domain-containing protein, partial [Candidatus Fimenecus sp.]
RITDGSSVKLLAIVTAVKKKTTKNDTTMAFVTVEDLYGSIELLVFPQIYAQFSHLLQVGNILLVEGRVSLREEESAKVIPDRISPCPNAAAVGEPPSRPSAQAENSTQKSQAIPHEIQTGLLLLVDTLNSRQDRKVKNLLSVFEGNVPVYLYYNDTKKKYVSARGVDVNIPLLNELKELLGEKGVMLK